MFSLFNCPKDSFLPGYSIFDIRYPVFLFNMNLTIAILSPSISSVHPPRFTTSTGRETTSCLPSQLVVKPLIFKRILTTNDEFWYWRDLVANGDLYDARTDCSITMYTRDYTEAFSWQIRNAWPAALDIEPLGTMIPGQGAGQKALMEVVTMVHEGMARDGHTSFSQALGTILDP